MTTLIVQGPQTTAADIERLAARCHADAITQQGAAFRLSLPRAPDAAQLAALRNEFAADLNLLPADFDPAAARLLVTDMDSTLIGIECIDEIADFLDLKPQVAEITSAAMRGEIDFETSLRRRIALLIGLDDSALRHVYEERLTLNPGAEEMIAGLQRHGIRVALVSGGFTYFTERLQQRLGLDYTLANELAFDGHGKLSGIANEEIVGAERKARFLHELCAQLGIAPQQAIAMGDGANDLRMMSQAGLSIAYHAKATVRERAHCVLNHCGLEGTLGLLGLD